MFLDSTRVNPGAKGIPQAVLAAGSFSIFACADSKMESRTKSLAFSISIPINCPLLLSSAVMLGLSSTLPASGSSEMAMCRTSSFSKYFIRALLISEPPSLQSEVDLLPRGDTDSHWSCLLPLTLAGHQNQHFVVASDHDEPLCRNIIVTLCGISHNVLYLGKVKATQIYTIF